jgi:signal transduction histidine kinase/CheY-like chemotaxis protein
MVMVEKLKQTALMQLLITAAAMTIDFVFNVIWFPNASYNPLLTFGICTVVGVPFTYYNTSLRINAQNSRRALAESKAARDDALAHLELALEEAEAASRAKSAFVATLSHEIRTPLNGVLGMADAMAEDPLADVQRERLEVIRSCGQAVIAQLNDVLDLSKIEAGRMELENIEFDMVLAVEGAARPFAALAKAKGLEFEVDVAAARGTYRGDPTRLRQVLYNLISNALKFTETGAIGVEVRPVGEGRLRFAVSDTGIGMSRDVLDTLFSKYVQGEASTTRRFGGTGLGLAICRELVEMMGGQISVSSAPGEGARFAFEIPLTLVATPQSPAASAAESMPDAALTALRVLAADDNPINRLVLQTLLRQVGVEPVMVNDGAAALAAWKADRYDIILMDARMPVMDGPAAARAIRQAEISEARGRTPIIALTADVVAEALAEFQAAGIDAHVAKPVEAARLFRAIEDVLSGVRAMAQSAA